jgi:hypothetical protein
VVEVVRKQREDAGVTRETPRDAAALQWLSEMGGAPLDLVGELLGTSQTRTYEVVARWHRAGWVHKGRPVIGPTWVWPTSATARRMLGWESVNEWSPRPATAEHTRAVAAVRLHWGASSSEQWIGERALRKQSGWRSTGDRVGHVPDGVWTDTDGKQWAIEVEITPKGPTRTSKHVLQVTSAVARQGAYGVRYVATRAATGDVRAAMAEAPEQWRGRLLVEPIEDIPMWRWQQ